MEIITPYVILLSAQKPKNLTLVPNDPGSRYKTRQLQIQVVGKSKMIKTCLLNILDVAKDMQVPPSYIGTFMGHVIGAQAKFDTKKPERQQAYLSGEHDPKDLSKIMLAFINEVLLCPTCGLPEIMIEIEKNSLVFGSCRACGSHSELKIQDEKFKRYVINHPPTLSKGAFAGNKASAKKDTSKAKEREEKPSAEETTEQAPVEEKPKEKSKKSRKDKEEEVVWFTDTSEEGVRKRREEMLPDSMVEVKKAGEVELLNAIIEAIPSGVEALQQVKNKHKADDKTFVTLLFNASFPTDCDLLAQIKTKSGSFEKFLGSEAAQIAFLSAIENHCGKVNTAQLTKVPLIIKDVYDKELLDEESIFAWNDKETENAIPAVREQASPMIKWLKEAEEESDEDDE